MHLMLNQVFGIYLCKKCVKNGERDKDRLRSEMGNGIWNGQWWRDT